MLSEEYIDKLAQPFADRELKLNEYIMDKLATRIKEISELSPSDIYAIKQLMQNGTDMRLITKALADTTNLQVAEIRKMVSDLAYEVYKDSELYYLLTETPYIPFEDNIAIQRTVEAIAKETEDAYLNLSNTRAYMLRDLQNPQVLIPTPASKVYQAVIDEAIQWTQQGVVDFNTMMDKTVRQLANSGLKTVVYNTESGKIFNVRMDTAVRRNILDGIRAVNQQIHNIVGEQINTNAVEISVHEYPAPDHAPVQGHIFLKEEYAKMQTDEDFVDIDGNKYSGFPRAIGQWNCMHFAYPYDTDTMVPNYTKEQLQQILDRNEKGYTTKDGKHYTMYECTQVQRKLETNIRKARDGYNIANMSGNKQLADKYKSQVKNLTNEYITFSNACGLKEKMSKTISKIY